MTLTTLDVEPAAATRVRDLYVQLMEGWNAESGRAFAAPFAQETHLVAFDGTHFRRRREIAEFHGPLLSKWLKGTRLVGRVESVEFLAPDVALMHAVGGTVRRGKTEPSPARDSIQTLVAVRANGEWQLKAFQNTRIRRMGPGFGSLLLWTVTDWLWGFLRRKRPASDVTGVPSTVSGQLRS